MCGIVGAVTLANGTPIDRSAIDRVIDSLAHRGPDGRGAAHGDWYSVGARRLAIIDTDSRAGQPLWDVSGQFVGVHNGEIYNYRELRSELTRNGARFRTQSDTEVVVEAYKAWGEDCLDRLDGMFAFAVVDCRAGRILVARDRIGVKPLYYAVCGDVLVFASEIKAVVGYPAFRRELAADSLIRFLRFRYVPFGDQYYRGLVKLPPAHALTVRDGRVLVRRYWDLNVQAEDRDASPEEVASLVESAVRRQLHADVPVSILLSGGIDSSVIAMHARDTIAAGGAAFTARVDGAAYDETGPAAAVARALGLEHEIVPISPVSLDAVRRLVRVKDQPLGMHNELALADLAVAVARRSKVVLCGEGADELFAGYPRMFQSEIAFARHRADDTGGARAPADPFWRFVLDRYFYVPDAELRHLLRPEFHALLQDDLLAGWLDDSRRATSDRFRQLTHFFIGIHLTGLLEMVDAATMAAGVEARVPYTDCGLVEAAVRMPKRRKLRWRSPLHRLAARMLPLRLWTERCDISKAVLRDAYRPRLPTGVCDRRKMGFPTPMGRWMAGNEEVRDLVLGSGSPLEDYFVPARLRAWYQDQPDPGDDTFGRRLWLITNLGLFLTSQP